MRMLVAVIWAVPFIAVAQDVPRMLKGMEKGQWRMEMLEHSEAKKGRQMPAMTMCSDNLMKDTKERQAGKKAQNECKQRLLKDTADEAVMETTCNGRTSTVSMKRESARSLLMSMQSTGPRGSQSMKMRYTHLGACSAGQGSVTFDKNSPQCQALRQQAQMDPAATCARQTGDKERCMQGIRDMKQRFMSMCGG